MIDLLSPSSLIRHMHDALKQHEANGCYLHPEACSAMLRNLRTIEELTRNVEEELKLADRMLKGELAAKPERPKVDFDQDKVLLFPSRPRLVVTDPEGGDAA